ncbi:MAG: M13 family peptidase, partial [Vicinamibacteraceae bacterium]
MTTRTLIAVAAVLLAGDPAASRLQAQSGQPTIGSFGVDTTQMDPSVKPGDDFFRYVNGKWLATVAIPADRARFGMFDALRDQAEANVHALVESLAKAPQPAGSVRQKVGDLYASYMDQARLEARGLEPLQGDLAAIAAAATKADLVRLM